MIEIKANLCECLLTIEPHHLAEGTDAQLRVLPDEPWPEQVTAVFTNGNTRAASVSTDGVFQIPRELIRPDGLRVTLRAGGLIVSSTAKITVKKTIKGADQ